MTDSERTLWTWRAARLRGSFDESFAEPADAVRARGLAVLSVIAGGHRCAIPLTDCAGVVASAALAESPSRVRGFRGFTSAGGVVRPVYELADWLGLTASRRARPPLLFARAHPVAFALDAIEGQADAGQVSPAADPVRLISLAGSPARLVPLDPILEAIDREARAAIARASGGR